MLLGGVLLALAVGVSGLTATFVLVVALVIYLSFRYYRARDRWTHNRLNVTGQVVEQLLARETRLVQQQPEYWHRGEDLAVDDYRSQSFPG